MSPATMSAVASTSLGLADLTGRQKVAILLMALGEEVSSQITRSMDADDVEQISLEIARMKHVPPEVVEAVLDEWEHTERAAFSLAEGGVDFARKILEKAFGSAQASQILKRIETQLNDQHSLYHLRKADPQQLTALIRNEHPQVIALILAYLDPAQTAAVLRELESEFGGEVVLRMARMEKVMPDVLEVVHAYMGSDSGLAFSAGSAAGGPKAVAEVLNLVGPAREKDLLDGVTREDPELSVEIKNLMFVFEDIAKLDSAAITRLLRDVETRDLAIALKVASEGLREKISGTMSQRARDALQEETEFLGPIRASDVENAQAAIVAQVRVLEETGEIVIRSADDQVIA